MDAFVIIIINNCLIFDVINEFQLETIPIKNHTKSISILKNL